MGEAIMIKKTFRRMGRAKIVVRYRKAAEPPTPAEAVRATNRPTPPWHGQRVKIEDLPSFKARWGLVTVYAEWPEGERCPRLYLVEMEPWKPID
jgi:hypothetical protein